ncbi:Gfo/Idh/MocA family oxidoreductase [bacterium]|nr:Gfo/Idh/MocA family oxidoreductase [candidate division CSSED10-310 bacterium]
MNLNFALVGCGRIASKYGEILRGNHVRNATLVAACDINPERARSFGDRFGIPVYPDAHRMIQTEKNIDVLCILTPSGLHAEHCIDLTQYKKHMVVEKPMALTIDDADDMIHACDRAGVRLFVVKQNRYNPPVQRLRKALDENRFGRLVMGTVRVRWCRHQDYYDQDDWRGTWSLDGGVFTNQASHHVDLLEWMLGDPVSVFAKSSTKLVDIEVENSGVAVLKFREDVLGVIEVTTATRPTDLEGSISILGEKGSVVIGGFAVNEIQTWNFIDHRPDDDRVFAETIERPPNVYGFGHIPYLENVVNCIQRDERALVDGLEGRKSLELISAIYESIETGREVFLRFLPKKCRLGMKHG